MLKISLPHFSSRHCQCGRLAFVVTASQIGWVRFQNSSAKMTKGCHGDVSMILNNVVVEERCGPSTRSSDTRMSLSDLTSWNSHLKLYLYHDVDVLAILQQTHIGIEVEPVVLGAGVSQAHLTVPEGLKEDLLPMCPLSRQQLPLKGHN